MSEYSTTGASTSAQLRQTQAALAASQADLTRAERERDEAKEQCRWLNQQRDLAEAELATARAELERLRNQTKPEGAS